VVLAELPQAAGGCNYPRLLPACGTAASLRVWVPGTIVASRWISFTARSRAQTHPSELPNALKRRWPARKLPNNWRGHTLTSQFQLLAQSTSLDRGARESAVSSS
jgi:hypothetical protein